MSYVENDNAAILKYNIYCAYSTSSFGYLKHKPSLFFCVVANLTFLYSKRKLDTLQTCGRKHSSSFFFVGTFRFPFFSRRQLVYLHNFYIENKLPGFWICQV